MSQAIVIVVHWAHVACAVYWLGSVLFTRIALFPTLAELPEGYETAVRDALVSPRNRRITIAAAGATVVLGIVRGLLDGVVNRLGTAYGATYLAATLIGLVMLAWIAGPWLKTPLFARLYVAGFPIMFTLMVLMRFGY